MATLDELNVIISADVSRLEAGILKGLSALADIGKAAISAAGDMQALEKGFAATYKGSEDLGTALAKVKELAKLPGLGLKEALQGATNLQAAGFSADLATRALGAFGNALATVGKGKADLNGVGLALSQIASKGKISAEEINQLAERVPQIRGAIQAAFGTSDTQALQKLNIDATRFVEGITAQLEKLPKVTGGINNALENLQDAGTTALAKLGTSFNNAFNIEGGINLVSDAVNALGDAFVRLEPTFRNVARYFSTGEGASLFTNLAASVKNAADEIANAFTSFDGAQKSTSFVKDLLRDIVVGFTAAADVIGGVVGTIARALKGDFAGAEVQAQRAIDGLTAPIRNALGLTTQLSGSFDDAFRNIYHGFDNAAGASGSFGEALAATAGLTADQQKALDKLRAALLENERASLAFGNSLTVSGSKYDFIGNKAKILEKGIADLSAVFAPNSALVQGYVRQLAGIPDAVDQVASRITKGLEKANQAPPLKLKLEADYGGSLDFANGRNPYNLPKRLATVPVDTSATKESLTDLQLFVGGFSVGVQKAVEGLSASVASALSGVAQGIGSALASGQDAMQAFGDGLLKAFGQIIVEFGEKLILLGIGNVAAQNYVVGAAQIAAGGLLVGAGAYVGATAGSASAGAGASTTGSRGSYTPANATAQPQRVQVEVVGTLKAAGPDLAAVLRTRDYRNLRTN